MKSLVAIAPILALIAVAGPALADSVRGKIVEIDNFNRISLEIGQVFKLAFGLRPSNYRKDDIVDVTWFTYAKGYRDAFAIKLIQRR